MNKIFFYISLLCLLVVCCTSCSSDSEEDIGGNTPILLSAQTVDGLQVRSIIKGGQALPEDLEVGVYISENGGSNASIASNQKYKADASGGLSFVDGSQAHYPSSGNGVTMTAYYPYNNGTVDGYDFSVEANQSTDADYNASDLLYSASTSYPRQTATHSLAFAHKLSRITYKLTAGAGAPNLSSAVVSIMDVFPEAEFNRTTGVLGVAKGTKTNIVSNANGTIVIPQTIAANTQQIKVSAGGNNYYYKPTIALTLESGKSYDFEITVKGTQLQVTYTVSNWADGTVSDNGGAVTARSYRVGDYYPDPNVDLTNFAEKAKIQGVVYWIDPASSGAHGKVVSLDEGYGNWNAGKTWCATKGDAWDMPAKDELKALYAGYSGKRYEDISDWEDYNIMPGYAAATCAAARTAFNYKLTAGGGVVLRNNWHWSSSENGSSNAWIVDFSDGNSNFLSKNTNNRVRAVSAF